MDTNMRPYRGDQPIRDLRREMDRIFEGGPLGFMRDASAVEGSQWTPMVDIREEAERFVVEADVPGVKPEDIEVTMEGGVLSIRGERSSESHTQELSFRREERVHGAFYRRFALPDTADPDAIKAYGRNGVLVIEIGKRETARPRRIPVES